MVTYEAWELARVRNGVLLITVVTWILLLAEPGSMFAHCPAGSSGATPLSLQMLLAMNPPISLAAGWALMLVAMMSPVLIPPIHHIRMRSFTHRRALRRAFRNRLCFNLDGHRRRAAGSRDYGPVVCNGMVHAGGWHGPDRVSLAALTHQAALSQSLPRE
jgi:hypothetical protein